MNAPLSVGPAERGETAAVTFDQPLLFTPRENLRGFVLSFAGRLFLFAVAAASVGAVFLIFVFIIRDAVSFFAPADTSAGLISGLWARIVELLGSTAWYPEADQAEFGALAPDHAAILAITILDPSGASLGELARAPLTR